MKTKSLNWVEINARKLRDNLKFMSSVLSSTTNFMLMVKGNAYGHGLIEVSRIASDEGATFLGVVSLDEVSRLRSNKISTPILLFAEIEEKFISEIVKYKITPTVYNLSFAEELNSFAKKRNIKIPIHIKVDTGLNRFGFKLNNSLREIVIISSLSNLVVEGIFTHFADAVDNLILARGHFSSFLSFLSKLKSLGITPKIIHASNSPALVWLKESHLNLVRFGLAAYGLQPSTNKQYPVPIKPVLEWKTKVLQIKTVHRGEYIGYGSSFKTYNDMRIAVIGVGYADGFRRSPQNYKNVLIRGVKVPIVGNVTMNFAMVDITNLEKVVLYDEVVLIGTQQNVNITLEEIASIAGTTNEEVVNSISPLTPRYLIE